MIRRLLDRGFRALGYEVRHLRSERSPFSREAISKEDQETINTVRPYTMTSWERIYAAVQAARYVHENRIEGSIVECGVWRGGSSMAMARTLASLNDQERELFLFDTYEGMPKPSKYDKSIGGADAKLRFEKTQTGKDRSNWCEASLEDVKENMGRVEYDAAKIHYIKGKVEETIPGTCPEQIAILRLDTDWYESTKHELEHLFPKLVPGGVLIIDDYGHWEGARKAVDEYFAVHDIHMLLHRIDYTGRIGVVQSS